MVQFLGIELSIGWEALGFNGDARAVFVCFAEGLGVGIGDATVVYLIMGSLIRIPRWEEWNEVRQEKNDEKECIEARNHTRRGRIPADFDSEYIILDLAHAHRIESTAARCAGELELRKQRLAICGLAKASGLHTNFPGEGFVGV
ncbi:hypothetical protein B0H13DRAFT_2291970 [Mycena leptocephala]|nr:hypothetical protein B0H13DRAFT_2291970 [Mycena leptocephala]